MERGDVGGVGAPSSLEDFGWSAEFERSMPSSPALRPARVSSVYAARVDLWTTEGPRLASLRSRVLRGAPVEGGIAVGDWAMVAQPRPGADEVVVEAILPRRTVFLRQAAGERSEPQAIAANVDRVFVVTALDSDFNLRRLERYLLAISAGGAEAHVVLSKADLLEDVSSALAQVSSLAPAFATSARSGYGIDELFARIPRKTTAVVVGSSGVGKSALVNRLLGREAQLEGEVRAHDGRGRHTTTRRQLFMLPTGGLLIDTPGMRELKPWLPEGAEVDDAFEDVASFAASCRYRDCGHAGEPGCAVQSALESGELDKERVLGWRKLAEEQSALSPRQATFESVEKRRERAQATLPRRRSRGRV